MTVNQDEPPLNQRESQRNRGGCCAAGLLTLLTAVAVAAWLIRTSTSYTRIRVVIPADAVTHCKLEYSISTRYSPQNLKQPLPPPFLAYNVYAPKPPPKWITWIQSHLDSRTAGGISVFGKHLNSRQNSVEDSWQAPGYTVPVMVGGNMRRLEFRHILVSNCTAIWEVSEWTKPGNHRSFTCSLMIHPLHTPVSYYFGGFADRIEDCYKVRKEMIAIRDSIKIEGL